MVIRQLLNFKDNMDVKTKVKRALAGIGLFVFNKKTGEVLGRTWKSWAKITSFFTILYAVLAGIFAVHLAVFIAITPHPAVGVEPWNYGQYGYPNYPNSKIVLVSHPKSFVYKRMEQEAVLSSTEKKYIQQLLPFANTSGVPSECLDESNHYGYDNGEPCIFIHVLKVYHWTPELINSTLDDDTTLLVECSFTSSNLDLNITSAMDGIPLNLSNNVNSRSFPFTGQEGYITPMMAIKLNLTGVPDSSPPKEYQGVVHCSIDLENMGLTTYSMEVLNRLYDVPADSNTKIYFKL